MCITISLIGTRSFNNNSGKPSSDGAEGIIWAFPNAHYDLELNRTSGNHVIKAPSGAVRT